MAYDPDPDLEPDPDIDDLKSRIRNKNRPDLQHCPLEKDRFAILSLLCVLCKQHKCSHVEPNRQL
jgi:hypothetical protein